MNSLRSTKNLTIMGVMAALSIVLIYTIRFPIIPAAPYLQYEPGDVPIFFITFLFGPVSGLVVTIIASLIQGMTVNASDGIVGILMHIFATGSFVLIAGNIYNKISKGRKSEIFALLAGTATMTVSMCLWNIIITPFYLHIPVNEIIKMILPVFVPFNLIKAGVNSIITFILFETVSKIFVRTRLQS